MTATGGHGGSSGRRLVLVWAMDRRGVIGRDGQLPWRLSDDLKNFKRTTAGAPVIMGRKTFESIGKALPRRTNIAVSREPRSTPGVHWVSSFGDALDVAIENTEAGESIYVIGGTSIYAAAIGRATHAEVTFVAADVEGDVELPFEFPTDDWVLGAVRDFDASAHNDFPFSIRSFERR